MRPVEVDSHEEVFLEGPKVDVVVSVPLERSDRRCGEDTPGSDYDDDDQGEDEPKLNTH